MVSPHPLMFPQRRHALGNDPSPKSESSWVGVTVWVSRQGVRVCLFVQGRVCQGVHPSHIPRLWGAGPVLPPSPNPGNGGWGSQSTGLEVRDAPCWVPPISSSLMMGSGLTISSCIGPGLEDKPTVLPGPGAHLNSVYHQCLFSHSHGGAGWR